MFPTLALGSQPSSLACAPSLRFGVPRQTPLPVPPRIPQNRVRACPNCPLAFSGLTAPGHPPAHLRNNGWRSRPANPETDRQRGGGEAGERMPRWSIWRPAHLGVAELHHHVLTAPPCRHLPPGPSRTPSPVSRVRGAPRSPQVSPATPRPLCLTANHWLFQALAPPHLPGSSN